MTTQVFSGAELLILEELRRGNRIRTTPSGVEWELGKGPELAPDAVLALAAKGWMARDGGFPPRCYYRISAMGFRAMRIESAPMRAEIQERERREIKHAGTVQDDTHIIYPTAYHGAEPY